MSLLFSAVSLQLVLVYYHFDQVHSLNWFSFCSKNMSLSFPVKRQSSFSLFSKTDLTAFLLLFLTENKYNRGGNESSVYNCPLPKRADCVYSGTRYKDSECTEASLTNKTGSRGTQAKSVNHK